MSVKARVALIVFLGAVVIVAWEIEACSVPAGIALVAFAIWCAVMGDGKD